MGCEPLGPGNGIRPDDMVKLEYLYIQSFIELLKKVEPGYIDPFITAQYIDQTKTFPVEQKSFALIERVTTNHKAHIVEFVNRKYEKVLRIIMKYMLENFKNPEKYDPVPMTPAMKRTVDAFLEEDKLTRIRWRFDRYNADTCGMDREVETMAAMVVGNFSLHESLMNEQYQTWKRDINNRVTNNQYATVDLIKLDRFIDLIGKQYILFLGSKPETIILAMKYIANLLNIVTHLVIPYGCVPKATECLYKDLYINGVLDINKVKSVILRNKALTRLNINNIITANDRYAVNISKDNVIPFESNPLIEQYLVLHHIVNNLGYFCGMV